MRWRRERRGLPQGGEATIAAVVPGWTSLDHDQRARLVADTDELLATKRWEAARGFELTDPMRVVIAAGAALLVLGLHVDAYRRVRSIIVHPSVRWSSSPRAGPANGVVVDGPVVLAGESSAGQGPLVIAWDRALIDARHPERGHNVVYHEFAHKLDLLDGDIDGVPPLAPDDERIWRQAAAETMTDLRRGRLRGIIDDYAATSPAELFAVTTELFFTRPDRLLAGAPRLYDGLRRFYRQDPAPRLGYLPDPPGQPG